MGVRIDVTYAGDLECRAVHAPSGNNLSTDAPLDNGGKAQSFSPTDLLATSLAACMLTVMGIAIRSEKMPVKAMTSSVIKDMASNPRRVSKLTLQIEVTCLNPILDQQKKLLEEKAWQCPVKQSIHPDIEVGVSFIYTT